MQIFSELRIHWQGVFEHIACMNVDVQGVCMARGNAVTPMPSPSSRFRGDEIIDMCMCANNRTVEASTRTAEHGTITDNWTASIIYSMLQGKHTNNVFCAWSIYTNVVAQIMLFYVLVSVNLLA